MSKMDSRGALRSERVSFGNEHQSQTYSVSLTQIAFN